MSALKALGPDGFLDGFYQKYWSIIGPIVTAYILEILKGRKGLQDINHNTCSWFLNKITLRTQANSGQ